MVFEFSLRCEDTGAAFTKPNQDYPAAASAYFAVIGK